MGQDLADRPWFRDERDQPDVTAAGWALERKLLPQPRHQLAISRMSPPQAGHSSGNSSPSRAISLAQAIREVSCERGF